MSNSNCPESSDAGSAKPWHLHEATPEQAESVVSVLRRVYANGRYPYLDEVRADVEKENTFTLLGEWIAEEGGPTPFMTGSLAPDETGERLEFCRAAILEQFRDAHHGDKRPVDDLIDRRLRAARRLGAPVLTTNAVVTHPKTQRLFQAREFVPVKFCPFEDVDMFGTGKREGGVLMVARESELDADSRRVFVPAPTHPLVERTLTRLSTDDRRLERDLVRSGNTESPVRMRINKYPDHKRAKIRCTGAPTGSNLITSAERDRSPPTENDSVDSELVYLDDAVERIRSTLVDPSLVITDLVVGANTALPLALCDELNDAGLLVEGFAPDYVRFPTDGPYDALFLVHIDDGPKTRAAKVEVTRPTLELLMLSEVPTGKRVEAVDDCGRTYRTTVFPS